MSSTDGSGRGATLNVGTQSVSENSTGIKVVVGGTPDPRRSSIPSEPGAPPFTGRRDDLAALDQAFAAPENYRVFVLHGHPGVGKSRLAKEYADTRKDRYPGGTFHVRCDAELPSDLTKQLPRLVLSRHHLGARPTLLVCDNVPDANGLYAWLPPAGTACHILATSTFTDWPPPWQARQVDLFPDDDARMLVGKLLTTTRTTAKDVEQVVRKACGITVELCACARDIDYEARHGRAASLRAALASDTESSFAAAWRLLSADAQLLLRAACMFAIGRILPDALQALLTPEGWDEARFHKALDAVRDRGLLAKPGEMFEVHQLMAAFVQGQAMPELPGALVKRHFAAFVAAADKYGRSPGDEQRRARLLAYPLELDTWKALSPVIPALAQHAYVVGGSLFKAGLFGEALPWLMRDLEVSQKGDDDRIDYWALSVRLHDVGVCHQQARRNDDALPFFERAIAAAWQAERSGPIDHERLGRSIHNVGTCHLRAGRFDKAIPFFHQAIKATLKGDRSGCIDYESLGRSNHQIGSCHLCAGRFAMALPFFKEAIDFKKQGDRSSHVDQDSLGKSLHAVGKCHLNAGRIDEALPFFDRAVEAMQKGDIHGHVDQASLLVAREFLEHCRAKLGLPPVPDR